MVEHYVWNTQAEAESALAYINSTSTMYPIVGRNAATGELEPDKTQLTCWYEEPAERFDGKWCFRRVKAEDVTKYGLLPDGEQVFLDTFSPTIEEYQQNWFQ